MRRKCFVTRTQLEKALKGDEVLKEQIENIFNYELTEKFGNWLIQRLTMSDERFQDFQNGPKELILIYEKTISDKLYSEEYKRLNCMNNQLEIKKQYHDTMMFISKIINSNLSIEQKHVIIDEESFFNFYEIFKSFLESKFFCLTKNDIFVISSLFGIREEKKINYYEIAKIKGVTLSRINQQVLAIARKFQVFKENNGIDAILNICYFEFDKVFDKDKKCINRELFKEITPVVTFNSNNFNTNFKLSDVLISSKRYVCYFLVKPKSNFNIDFENPSKIKIEFLELSSRAKNALINHGITTLSQILSLKLSELLRIRNIGEKTRNEILAYIDKYSKESKNSSCIRIENLNLSKKAIKVLNEMNCFTLNDLLEIKYDNLRTNVNISNTTRNEIWQLISSYKTNNKFGINNMDLEELDLSTRAKIALRRFGCKNLNEVLNINTQKLFKMRNVGKKTYDEIINFISKFNESSNKDTSDNYDETVIFCDEQSKKVFMSEVASKEKLNFKNPYSIKIQYLNLSTRAKNSLLNADINNLEELLNLDYLSILKIKQIGEKTQNEIIAYINKFSSLKNSKTCFSTLKNNITITELNLSKRAEYALLRFGCKSLDDVLNLDIQKFGLARNVGNVTQLEIINFISRHKK